MNIKSFKTIIVSVCLGCLATSLALAQPVITTQPKDLFLAAGRNASFSVVVTGAGPFTYQWLFDGVTMAGATGSGLFMANAQPTNSGYYWVIVSNASGSVTSQVARLKVFVAAPHGFRSIQAQSNGCVNLTFKGETTPLFAPYYDLYPLETSTNLANWALLTTLQRPNTALDTLQFIDTNAPQFSQRFYRTPTNAFLTPDPQPTGPNPVGTYSMLLTNPRRNNAKFMISLWYPAVAQAGGLPAKYVERQIVQSGYDFSSYGGGNFTSQVVAFFSHSLSNAPLVPNLARYPVVLYDPGSTGHRRENADKVEDLASWGFVVVGLDTSDTTASVLPSGAVVYGQSIDLGTTPGVEAAIESRVLDLQSVLDALQSLNAADPQLTGRLDLNNIGVLGYSLGGAAAAQLSLRDLRCKACASMDWVFVETNVLTQPPSFPYLFFRSDFGPDPDPGWTLAGWPDDRLEFYNVFVTNAYWVKLASTGHGSFGEWDLILDSVSMEILFGTPMSGQLLPPARAHQIERAYLLSFFNKFLQGEDDHLLDGPSPAYPEVIQFLSKAGSSVPPRYPSAALQQGGDGNFYGTTEYGGASGKGTVFQVTPSGLLMTLVSFNGTNGSHPIAGLVQGSDGNFYGTTEYGGTNGNNGSVFQVTPAGVLTTLISFNGTNGSHPAAGLVQGNDGSFYGTTILGGAYNRGTVFKTTPAGELTTLFSFKANYSSPFAALVQGTNGNFYGTTAGGTGCWFFGGSSTDYGTVFKMTPAGVLTTLVRFSGANGYNPSAGLVQGCDGNFYGTTAYGGNLSPTVTGGYGLGTVFKMTPAGALTTLVVFNGTNGSYSIGGLVQNSDGSIFGTTAGGGARGCGTVFKMTPTGVLTTLVSFNGPDGNSPQAPLVQGSDGNFYGTTTYGGASGRGTVFQVAPAGVLTPLVLF